MPHSVEESANIILRALATAPLRDDGRDPYLSGPELTGLTSLSPHEINNGVTLLVQANLAEWFKTIGSAPYAFRGVKVTPRGRYEFERTTAPQTSASVEARTLRPPSPVGSPYGFRDEDWELVADRRSRANVLYVVLGHQFVSDHYNTEPLRLNVERSFKDAAAAYNATPDVPQVQLDFRSLAAGYGEHLFNEIARDIISADIAVFETSDLNPNVMVEMGVALTWGVRVLPIKSVGRPVPPSDISGQTWADHIDSAASFADPEHTNKLVRMIERSLRKKARA